jgi:hypothetical protein
MSCTPTARLLFIGMWNFADDNGVISYSPVQIKAKIFPGDTFSPVDISAWINELVSNGLLKLFRPEDGRLYLFVTGWKKHQKIDRPNAIYPVYDPKFEVISEPESSKNQFGEHSASFRRAFDEHSTSDRRQFDEHSTNDRRTIDDNSTNDRRQFDEHSTSIRRAFDEHSPPEGKGKERIGVEGKGKEGYREENPDQKTGVPDSGQIQISAGENLPGENNFPDQEKISPELKTEPEPVLLPEAKPKKEKEKTSAQKEKTGLATLVHARCRDIFTGFYQDRKKSPYLGWCAKDAAHLKLIIGNIMGLIRSHGKEPDGENIPETFAFMLQKLPDIHDRWVYDHLSVANFSSKFNEITDQIINKTNGNRNSKAQSRPVGNRQEPGDDYLADILSRLDG